RQAQLSCAHAALRFRREEATIVIRRSRKGGGVASRIRVLFLPPTIADAARFRVAVLCKRRRMKPLLARPPVQIGQVNAMRIKPGGFTGEVPVMTLIDTASPSAQGVSFDPPPGARWRVEPIPFPG